jgi:hypothetical protein
MVNSDLVGGLRSALERGEPLKKAMVSLFNAGYKREEIEDAARNLDSAPVMGVVQPKKPMVVAPLPKSPSVPEKKPVQSIPAKPVKEEKLKPVKVQQYPQLQTAPVVQTVSSYERPPADDKAVITVLTIILIFLLSLLVTIFIFKNEIVNFFSNMLA